MSIASAGSLRDPEFVESPEFSEVRRRERRGLGVDNLVADAAEEQKVLQSVVAAWRRRSMARTTCSCGYNVALFADQRLTIVLGRWLDQRLPALRASAAGVSPKYATRAFADGHG